MKKAIVVTLTACLTLCGCGNGIVRDKDSHQLDMSDRFICNRNDYEFETVVDSKTGVTYLIWMMNNGRGGMTALLNADGTPVISEEVGE